MCLFNVHALCWKYRMLPSVDQRLFFFSLYLFIYYLFSDTWTICTSPTDFLNSISVIYFRSGSHCRLRAAILCVHFTMVCSSKNCFCHSLNDGEKDKKIYKYIYSFLYNMNLSSLINPKKLNVDSLRVFRLDAYTCRFYLNNGKI